MYFQQTGRQHADASPMPPASCAGCSDVGWSPPSSVKRSSRSRYNSSGSDGSLVLASGWSIAAVAAGRAPPSKAGEAAMPPSPTAAIGATISTSPAGASPELVSGAAAVSTEPAASAAAADLWWQHSAPPALPAADDRNPDGRYQKFYGKNFCWAYCARNGCKEPCPDHREHKCELCLQ